MSDLIPVIDQLPAYLRDDATTGDEFGAGIGASFPLGFLSIRGKEFRLRKDGKEANSRQRELSMVLVAARASMSKRFFKDKYVSGSTEGPDCSSADGVIPNVADPVHDNCTHCSKNQFGSRITESGKQGKACGDYKRIIVWVLDMGIDDPLVVDIPVTSLKAPKGQQHAGLMLGDYLAQLAKHGLDATKVVTKAAFTDSEYPQLCFAFERLVTQEERQAILDMRDSDDVATVLSMDMFDPGPQETDEQDHKMAAAAQQAAGAEEEKPKRRGRPRKAKAEEPAQPDVPAFPGEPTIMKQGDNLIIAQTDADWAKGWAEGFRPQQQAKAAEVKAPPKDEPASGARGSFADTPAEGEAPVTTGVDDAGADDLMAEVMALLKGGK